MFRLPASPRLTRTSGLGPEPFGAPGFLAGMRIRKKLIVLHTFFSLIMVAMLVLALRPAIGRIVEQAEMHEARATLALLLARIEPPRSNAAAALGDASESVRQFAATLPAGVRLDTGAESTLGLPGSALDEARADPGKPVPLTMPDDRSMAVVVDPRDGQYYTATVRLDDARQSVVHLYALLILALLAVYGLIAAALEILVLPRHVYGPIGAILRADRAVQENQAEDELVPDRAIPADELGEIMRSRNQTVQLMRRHEAALGSALQQLEQAANDLKRKNHLLEAAQRNLADADRLASLGTMSAGLAHEMNTPLSVMKGLAEKIRSAGSLEPAEAELLLRVVGRLERLSESLLDFARVRPAATRPEPLRPLIDEAWTLVKLDRAVAGRFQLHNLASPTDIALCDPDRLVQVLVNLFRNSADAMLTVRDKGLKIEPRPAGNESVTVAAAPAISVTTEHSRRDGRAWITISVADQGPGIDPAIIGRLFEPFASTRLDANGTGLGLAVSEGIVKEHGGLLLARNRPDSRGAVFEVTMPAE